MSVEPGQEQGLTVTLDLIETVMVRAIALVLLFFAIRYWMRVTGYNGGAEFRFDTMSEHWRVASASLSVLLPVAALGLWGRFSWGAVVWFLAAVQQIAMHAWFYDSFGRADATVTFQLVAIAVYGSLKLAEYFSRRRRR
ncbi:MAG: DUF6163 family protein [Salaquimonas sp.]|nr:DUF6163 family protein [Salaquimonas sp.]